MNQIVFGYNTSILHSYKKTIKALNDRSILFTPNGNIAIMNGNSNQPQQARQKKPVQERSKKTRKKILQATRELISDIGYSETTTHLIAQKAEISVGGLYAHFSNKREIFLAIIEEHQSVVFSFVKNRFDTMLQQKLDINDSWSFLIPDLYTTHKLNGQLELEIQNFIVKDKEAAELYWEWEIKEDNEVIAFLQAHKGKADMGDINSMAVLIHRTSAAIFQYLFRYKDRVNDVAVITEMIKMLKKYTSQ